jgi:molecular chaperone DnaK (HSP70)
MTHHIDLAPEEEARLRAKAAAQRVDVSTFLREAVMEKLDRPSLQELLAPIHAATEEARLTESDIDELADRGREDYWRSKQNRAG